ncbi:transcription termination factor 5, mitochondrial-like [Danaus plexippus]|uniref:transcription termination factor 5, mitochondrial-like n=1 Tax=Danaus plexippus TaxID=13037 RepID=UPI002AB1E2D6|nr:transcription termination factor 5, mitochondrial-like [Danaus plexippus]
MFYRRYGMILKRFYNRETCLLGIISFSTNYCTNGNNLNYLCKYLNISKDKAQYLSLKYPVMKNLDVVQIKEIVDILYQSGLDRNMILKNLSLFSLSPITLKFRQMVLQECGIRNITPDILHTYLTVLKQKKIGELKASGLISTNINIENSLASYMTQWPTSITTLVYGDIENLTLYSLRLKIIQRYLELMLDLTCEEFERGLHTYPTIKHRPLQTINKILNLLQREVLMPNHKIKSNLYLFQADPDNLNDLIYKFCSIGGIDIKEVFRLYPKLVMKKYSTMLEIKNVLEEFGISNEAQKRCFQIYTLSPSTIRERLENAKTIPEFKTFFNHPRFLKIIHYNTKALKRIMKLYDNNKKCLSLNILSGSGAHYEVYEKSTGDRLGKSKDLIFCITQSLGHSYSASSVRNIMKRHPFWINIPLVQISYVYDKLSTQFSASDIFENCPILLYPWNKIKSTMEQLDKGHSKNVPALCNENINTKCLTKSQKLSLILYLLERNHYFTGNGVWTDEKQRNNIEICNANQAIN